ncbi:MAG TPA: GxxExxY protein [Polyangia bacterium]
MGLEQEELTGSVIGAVIEVHKALGPGFLESVYENGPRPRACGAGYWLRAAASRADPVSRQ